MSPLLLAFVACATFGVSVYGQPATFTLTAANQLENLYVDNINIVPLPNGGDWQTVDVVPIETYARLVSIRANNVLSGCSGIMAAIKNSPIGIDHPTNASWRCSASAPDGWHVLGYDDSTWREAFPIGRNGDLVPGCSVIPIPDLPQNAYWIWTESFIDGDQIVSCRGYTSVCDQEPCFNGGTCQRNALAICRCPVRWTGRFCDTPIDECASNPCQNGGRCNLDDNGYTCSCNVGFTGTHCETDATVCASNPCQNGGTCIFNVGDNEYSCACRPGYSGVNCEFNVDECESDPCLNGATCVDGINSVTCTCAPGFQGPFCDINFNECQSNPCQFSGTCNDLVNSYDCSCHAGYTGVHCETAVGDCEVNPCQNGGTCTLNGAGGAVDCLCTPGWYGALCDSNQDECTSNPCLNGGTCVDSEGSFECQCTSIFQGETCADVVPNCGSIMSRSIYPPVRNFWVLCEINLVDHPSHVNTRCRDLITGINFYNDSSTITALGGTFGCYVTKSPEVMPDGACIPEYTQDAILSTCLSCTHMGVCIREPPRP